MTFIIFLTIIGFVVSVHFLLRKRRSRATDPPLVPGHWILGNAADFSRDAVGLLLRSRYVYGDVFTLRLVNKHVTIVMDPQFKEKIGKNSCLSFERIQQQVNRNVFGFKMQDAGTLIKETAATVNGKHLVIAIEVYLKNLNASIENLKRNSRNVKATSEKIKVGLRPFVASTIFDAIFTSIFGNSGDNHFNSEFVFKNFEVFHEYFNHLWLGMPLLCFPRARRALSNLQTMPDSHVLLGRSDLSLYLRRAICHMLNVNQSEADIKGHNLVYLHVNYNTFRFAYWSLYFLLKHEEARKSIRHELEEVLGPLRTGEVVLSERILDKLLYLESFVRETYRISSGVFIVRHVISDTTIHQCGGRDYSLRAGDLVAMFPPSIHKDPSIFEDPIDFRHDRFVQKNCDGGRQLTSLVTPFGCLCPGKKYANIQLKLFVISALLNFDLSSEDEGELDFEQRFSGHEVLPPKKDIDVVVSFKDSPRIRFAVGS